MEAIARLRGVLAALIAASAACLLGANAALAGTLDQQQTDLGGGGYGIQSAQSIAQTFTAAATGGVDQVDLALYRGSTVPTLPLNVEIRDVSSGKPGSTVLAGQTLAGAALTTSPAFVSINFSPPAPVTAGTQYAIVASSAQTLPAFYAWVGSAAPDPYPAGGSFAQPFLPAAPGRRSRPRRRTWASRPTFSRHRRLLLLWRRLRPRQGSGRPRSPSASTSTRNGSAGSAAGGRTACRSS